MVVRRGGGGLGLLQGEGPAALLLGPAGLRPLGGEAWDGQQAPASVPDFSGADAYRGRGTTELLRGLAVFRACSLRAFVERAEEMYSGARRLLGPRLADEAVRRTFFRHFCAGESSAQLASTLDWLREHGVGGIVNYHTEGGLDGGGEVADHQSAEERRRAVLEHNLGLILESIEMSARAGGHKFIAIKLTSMAQPSLLEKLSEALKAAKGAGGLQGGDVDPHQLLTCHMNAVRSGRRGMDALESWADAPTVREADRLLTSAGRVAEAAAVQGVRVLVDAEQTYLQPAVDYVTAQLQRAHNGTYAVLLNTYQAYLKDSAARLEADLLRCRSGGYTFGGKLVRGAYMVEERRRAEERAVPSPVHDTKRDTDGNYNRCARRLLREIGEGRRAEVVLATHNHDSVNGAVDLMRSMGMAPQATPVYFAQLMGMSDYLTFSLGHSGYKVLKCLPYGPVHELMPFLVRRAQENADVMGGVAKDVEMTWAEIRRRVPALLPHAPGHGWDRVQKA
ncbi:unnamed protein product [Ostreobium quekettii]|uniref:Proline dehydrogenase n=1 Tax=Ostreobium quekettii TaxID=121088 RepID=A0A8S1INF0_9CHLO|nr:unnamed protein product [Ostreobium quekettii]|eukprot:evm.model.scf_136.1 EVM.evm.TU.scf_136.1   scf_136:4449-13621(+)